MNPNHLDLTVLEDCVSSDVSELVARFAALLGHGSFESIDFDGGLFSA